MEDKVINYIVLFYDETETELALTETFVYFSDAKDYLLNNLLNECELGDYAIIKDFNDEIVFKIDY